MDPRVGDLRLRVFSPVSGCLSCGVIRKDRKQVVLGSSPLEQVLWEPLSSEGGKACQCGVTSL